MDNFLQKFPLLDTCEEGSAASVLIGSPPRPSEERIAEEEEESDDDEEEKLSTSPKFRGQETDLELLSERLRNLKRISPNRNDRTKNSKMSNSDHHHPLLDQSETPMTGCQFSDDMSEEDDDEDEILATLSPPPSEEGQTSPFPGGLSQSERPVNHDYVQSSKRPSAAADSSAESLALTLLGAGANVAGVGQDEVGGGGAPRVCELKWLVGDWDTPQKVNLLLKILFSVVQSGALASLLE